MNEVAANQTVSSADRHSIWKRTEGAWQGELRHRAVLKSLFASFKSVPFTSDTARVFGKLRSDLAQKGSPIGPLDLQIASIAALNGLILVTSNTREFTRISGLQVEDWSV